MYSDVKYNLRNLLIPLDFGQRRDTAMWIKNKEPVIQNGRHMYRPKLTQALPVSLSTVSPSLPPTTGSDCVSTSNRPLVWPFRVSNWTAVRKQCQDCYPEHSGVYGENLALFTSTQWKLSLQHSAQMELCVADSCLNSLSVTALGLVTTLFSQLCTWFKSCSTFWHDWLQLKEGEFFLSFFNPLNGVVFTEPKMLFTTFNRHLLKTTNYNMTSFFCKDWVTLF